MSKIIQIRQRIKAIQTIHKIIHAMRLISMSSHARLKVKRDLLQKYTYTLEHLYNIAHYQYKSPTTINTTHTQPGKRNTLCIIIGAQRGLCGKFNYLLETAYLHHHPTISNAHADIIAVGKRVFEKITLDRTNKLLHHYPQLSINTLNRIAHEIMMTIVKENRYTHIYVLGTHFKSFFIQQPLLTTILPFDIPHATEQSAVAQEYTWDIYSNSEIIEYFEKKYLETTIYKHLLESLLSEQAARFISMDGAARNAQELLQNAKLQYNKLRQTSITKEITELSGSFLE